MPENLKSVLESILFITPKPLVIKKIGELLETETVLVEAALIELTSDYEQSGRGVRLMMNDGKVQIVTAAENASFVDMFIKDDVTGELTRPALETLTIIAYRGPIQKSEIEMIRGVNCTLILRNLMIRGLVAESEVAGSDNVVYSVTFDFLRHLGIENVSQLPDYTKLNGDLNGIDFGKETILSNLDLNIEATVANEETI